MAKKNPRIGIKDITSIYEILGINDQLKKNAWCRECISRGELLKKYNAFRELEKLDKSSRKVVTSSFNTLEKGLSEKNTDISLQTFVAIINAIIAEPSVKQETFKLNYSTITIQKFLASLNKANLAQFEFLRSHLNDYLGEISDMELYKNHFGPLRINETWQLDPTINSKVVSEEEIQSEINGSPRDQKKRSSSFDLDAPLLIQYVAFIEKFNPTSDEHLEVDNVALGELTEDNEDVNEETEVEEEQEEAFHFDAPASLLKKLCPEDWELFKDKIEVPDNKIGAYFDMHPSKGLCLTLNAAGRSFANHSELNEEQLLRSILAECDASNPIEFELFTQFTLKKRFIQHFFDSLSFPIELFFDREKFPSDEKSILIHRLIGNHYASKASINPSKYLHLMRNNYDECIRLLDKQIDNERTSFYLEYANYEYRIGDRDKAIQQYQSIIEKFKRPNSTVRFQLAIHHQHLNQGARATNLLCQLIEEDDKLIPFYQSSDFIKKLSEFFSYQFSKGMFEEANHLQNVIRRLTFLLLNLDQGEIVEKLLLTLNQTLDSAIMRKQLIEAYIRIDIDKAEEELSKELNYEGDNNLREIDILELKIKFFNKKESGVDHAEQIGLEYIETHEENPDINLTNIFLALANIYFRHGKFQRASRMFERIQYRSIETYPNYIVSQIKVNKNKGVIKAQNYFRLKPNSVNMNVLSAFVSACIALNRIDEAALVLENKLSNSRAFEFGAKFISFLYQQQIRLAETEAFAFSLFNKALEYSIDPIQKSFVHHNYGKYLLDKSAFGKHKDEDEFQNTVLIELALSYFNVSNKILEDENLEPNPINLIEEAKAYYFLKRYPEAIETLNRIISIKFNEQKKYSQVKILTRMGEVNQALAIFEEMENETSKKKAAFFIAQESEETLLSEEKRISLYNRSIKDKHNLRHRLSYAIHLERKGQLKQSRNILTNGKKLNTVPIWMRDIFFLERKRNEPNTDKQTLIKLRSRITSLWEKKRIDWNIIKDLDNLIEKHEFEFQLYEIKFKILFHFKKYTQCQEILNRLIEIGLTDPKSATLFYELAQNYYQYSFINETTLPRSEKVIRLKLAIKYIGFSLYFDQHNLKYHILQCCLLNRVGDEKLFKRTTSKSLSALSMNNQIMLKKAIKTHKRTSKEYFWLESILDQSTKLSFYRLQERTAVALATKNNVHVSVPLKIYTSILNDNEFHVADEYVYYNHIKKRVAHLYYTKKMYDEALKVQIEIFDHFSHLENFVGAVLKTIGELKEYDLGIQITAQLLASYPSSYLFLKQAYFYRKKEAFDSARSKIGEAHSLCEVQFYKVSVHLESLLLTEDSLKKNDLVPGETKDSILELSTVDFSYIEKTEPFSDRFVESSRAFQSIKSILKSFE